MTRRSFILPRTFAGQSEIQLVLKYTQNQHQSNSTYLANETPPSSPASTSDDDDDKDDDPESDYGDELTMASSELGADMPGELLSEQLKAICEATEGATDPALIALHRKCQVDNVLSALVGARVCVYSASSIASRSWRFVIREFRRMAPSLKTSNSAFSGLATESSPAWRALLLFVVISERRRSSSISACTPCTHVAQQTSREFIRILDIVSAHDCSTVFVDRVCSDHASLKTLLKDLMQYYLRRLEVRLCPWCCYDSGTCLTIVILLGEDRVSPEETSSGRSRASRHCPRYVLVPGSPACLSVP